MKIKLFPSFFSVIIGAFILFSTSCKIDYIWHDDVKKFVEDGLAIPIFTAPIYSGTDLPAISDKNMFQIGMPYTATIAVSNPKKLALDYRVRTKTPALFQGITDDVVATGKLKASSDTVTFSFLLNASADKNDIEFYLDVWSAMRSYETPKMDTIWVNARPSRIIPQKKASSGALSDADILEPDFSGTFATIYWSYPLTGTNTDIAKVKVLYTVSGVPGETEITLDPASGKFGDNSCSVPDVPSGATVDFSVTVYDSEGLGSEAVATGNFVPQKAPVPTFVRDVGINRNKIIVTSSPGTRLFCRRDGGVYTEQTSPYVMDDLVTSHLVQAYATQYGLLDSDTVSPDYPNYIAQYVVRFDSNGGSPIPSTIATYGARITPVPPNPTCVGQVFGVWRTGRTVDDPLWNFGTDIFTSTHDITLYVDWTDYTVRLIFHPEGGSLIPDYQEITEATMKVGDSFPGWDVMYDKNPDYCFAGWWTTSEGPGGGGTEFTSTTLGTTQLLPYYSDPLVTPEVTLDLYAFWDPTNQFVQVNFITSGGSVVDSQTVKQNDYASRPAPPTRAGYTFTGLWYQDSGFMTSWSFSTPVTNHLVLYAGWSATPSPIYYDLAGGTNNPGNPSEYYVETPSITLLNPTKPGLAFAGWYSDSSYTTPVTSIPTGSTGNINLYATWAGYTTAAVTITLNNPTDTTAVLTYNGNPVTGALVLRRRESITVTLSGPTYIYYGWSVDGVGTKPLLTGNITNWILTADENTNLAVFTTTIFFGNNFYEYSKSFTVQVMD